MFNDKNNIMETQKWMAVTSGHSDYVKIVTEITNDLIAYYDTTSETVNDIQTMASIVVNSQNLIFKKLRDELAQ